MSVRNQGRTLFDNIWQQHVVADLSDGFYLLFVDRHFVNDLAARAFVTLKNRGLRVRNPELTFATPDHTVATLWNRAEAREQENPYIVNLRHSAAENGVRLFDLDGEAQGIIHLVAAEQGLALPGLTATCGDSHVCTLGALGALGWGIGQSEVVHVLATQTSVQRKPKAMRISIEGNVPRYISPKDIMLYVIGRIGVAGAAGYAVEFAGSVIRQMPMEGRFTVCNMAIELGARYGLIAPDEFTYAYLQGLPFAPRGSAWETAVRHWRQMGSGEDAVFDRDISVDISNVEPQITWGTSPDQVIGISEAVPARIGAGEAALERALQYTGLESGQPIKGTPIDIVFIGSCTNSRISDLRAAASIAQGRRVAPGVIAWVVPGSQEVKRQAEAEGLNHIFETAGFQWGNPGCSLCAGSGDQMREIAGPRKRLVSTTNRNFAGRQGPGSRTHLVSPAMAAAAAVTGRITDVRELGDRHG
jgi:3-isopropylmalate/(R)-2-methylmalate dehydratase large subunit